MFPTVAPRFQGAYDTVLTQFSFPLPIAGPARWLGSRHNRIVRRLGCHALSAERMDPRSHPLRARLRAPDDPLSRKVALGVDVGPPRAGRGLTVTAVRNKKIFNELVTSIAHLGLKKPITVSGRSDQSGYNLVCGQGRLEAFMALGQTEIPAVVLEATEEDCFVMSLPAPRARRNRDPPNDDALMGDDDRPRGDVRAGVADRCLDGQHLEFGNPTARDELNARALVPNDREKRGRPCPKQIRSASESMDMA